MDRYWLIGGGALVGILLVVSIVISVTSGETEFDSGTPEFTVQEYVKALVSEDYEAAEGLWSPELSEDCSFEAFALDAGRGLDDISEARITLDETKVVGETTVVTVGVVRTTGGGIFGPSEFESSYDFGRREFDGEWLLIGHTWPGDRCIRSRFVPEPPPAKAVE